MKGTCWTVIAIVLAVLVLAGVACQGENAGSGQSGVSTRSGGNMEAKNQRYIQPYANPQLNSFQTAELKASGNRDWKLAFNQEDFAGGARYVYVIDDRRAVIDYEGVFFAIDLKARRTISAPLKSSNSFIRLGEGQLLYLISGYALVPLEFDRILGDRIGMEEQDSEDDEPEVEEEDKPPRRHYYVPGLGDYSILYCLYPDSESFIAGIQGTGTPQFPQPSFALYEISYGDQEPKWNWGFDGVAVVPPVSSQGQVVVARENMLSLFSRSGGIVQEIEGEFEPISCSIGPDDRIYLLSNTPGGAVMRVYDFSGKRIWKTDDVTSEPVQPPIVGIDSIVYLIDKSKVRAYRDGSALWFFPVVSDHPAATVTANGNLLIADGARVVCLDPNGGEVWTYLDEEGDTFVTPPVVDMNGNVLVASDSNLLMLK